MSMIDFGKIYFEKKIIFGGEMVEETHLLTIFKALPATSEILENTIFQLGYLAAVRSFKII